MAQVSRECYNVDTTYIIVKICPVCILETQNLSGSCNFLPFEQCRTLVICSEEKV